MDFKSAKVSPSKLLHFCNYGPCLLDGCEACLVRRRQRRTEHLAKVGSTRRRTRTERIAQVRFNLFSHLQACLICQMTTRLWRQLTTAIINKDMEAATDAKLAVEDAQRIQRRKMEESGEKHVPRFFTLQDGRWVPKVEYVFSSIPLTISLTLFPCTECPMILKQQRRWSKNGYSACHQHPNYIEHFCSRATMAMAIDTFLTLIILLSKCTFMCSEVFVISLPLS